MARKLTEATIILRNLNVKQLTSLHRLRGNTELFDGIKEILSSLAAVDKDKIVGLTKDARSVDEAIEIVNRQNFYRGRVNAFVLLHALLINAESEMEKRERKSG